MTDTNGTNGPAGGENANLATQQDGSSSSIDASTIFNALKDYPEFQKFVASQAQSKHDKRINKIEKTVGGLAEQIAQVDKLTESGLPRDFAIQWLEMQNSQAQGLPGGAFEAGGQTETQGGTGVDDGQDDKAFEQVAQSMGFDPNGPEVLLVRREGGTPFEKAQKLASLKAQGKPVEPNRAATLSTNAGQPAASADLRAKYEAELQEIGYGKPNQVQILKEKYRKQGLDIF